MLQISKYLKEGQLMRESRLYAGSGTTRWEDVFGAAKANVHVEGKGTDKVDSGYFSPPSGKQPASSTPSVVEQPASVSEKSVESSAPLSAYASMTSVGLGLQVRQIEYDRYKKTNDLEKELQVKKEYDVSKITNPFHHVKTNNPFNGDLKAAFKELYGDWDGKSEDGRGFAYVDKYGFSHVADNFFSAMVYSMDGKVYNYEGKHFGGYAVTAKGERIALLGLENSVLYGNFENGDPSITIPEGVLAKRDLHTDPMTPAEKSKKDFVSYAKLPLFDFSKMALFRDHENEKVGRADS